MFSLYVENLVKGLGKTTGGVLVLFTVYPLFVLYDQFLTKKQNDKYVDFQPKTPPSTPAEIDSFSKLDEKELHIKVKESLDQLM